MCHCYVWLHYFSAITQSPRSPYAIDILPGVLCAPFPQSLSAALRKSESHITDDSFHGADMQVWIL